MTWAVLFSPELTLPDDFDPDILSAWWSIQDIFWNMRDWVWETEWPSMLDYLRTEWKGVFFDRLGTDPEKSFWVYKNLRKKFEKKFAARLWELPNDWLSKIDYSMSWFGINRDDSWVTPTEKVYSYMMFDLGESPFDSEEIESFLEFSIDEDMNRVSFNLYYDMFEECIGMSWRKMSLNDALDLLKKGPSVVIRELTDEALIEKWKKRIQEIKDKRQGDKQIPILKTEFSELMGKILSWKIEITDEVKHRVWYLIS